MFCWLRRERTLGVSKYFVFCGSKLIRILAFEKQQISLFLILQMSDTIWWPSKDLKCRTFGSVNHQKRRTVSLPLSSLYTHVHHAAHSFFRRLVSSCMRANNNCRRVFLIADANDSIHKRVQNWQQTTFASPQCQRMHFNSQCCSTNGRKRYKIRNL